MSSINVENAIQEASQLIAPKLESLGLDENAFNENASFVIEFNKIAAGMLSQEPALTMPGSNQEIPFNEQMFQQALNLFSEGVFFALYKCLEFQITGDLKTHFMQQLALDIYNQAKQVVASTIGQESTPEFQFTHEQQTEFMTQSAESALLYYIAEYEKEYGPIHPEEPPALQAPPSQPEAPPAVAPSPPPPMAAEPAPVEQTPTVPLPPAAPPTAASPNHEKYGAVALLLTALPADQRARMLQRFSADEKELIAFYSYPQHIEQNLDVAAVEKHLEKLKTLFLPTEKQPRSKAHQQIAALAGQISREKLLSCIKDERPVVKRYLSSFYAKPANAGPSDDVGNATLPSRLEEILSRYLARRLEPELRNPMSG